jgi:hypothetical protein
VSALTRIHNKAWPQVINQKDLAPGIIIPLLRLGPGSRVEHPSKDAHRLHSPGPTPMGVPGSDRLPAGMI